MKIQIELTNDITQNLQNVLRIANLSEDSLNSPFFSTPFFRKYVASQDLSDLVQFYLLVNYIKNVNMIYSIWKTVPVDYFQNFAEILQKFELHNVKPNTYEWLGNNMSSHTFLHMIAHFYSRNKYQDVIEQYTDAMKQLSEIIDRNYEVSPPNRWRLQDFHDYMSHLYMKSTVINKEHNNEFLPLPVEVNGYKLYQPKDTLELAVWGKRVRNCVLSYENKIIANNSVIVLIEENENPKYTVELDYESLKNGDLQVKQVVGIANSSLNSDERSKVSDLLNQVIAK